MILKFIIIESSHRHEVNPRSCDYSDDHKIYFFSTFIKE